MLPFFEMTRLKDRKLLILPTTPLFDAPARGDPFRILWWNLASENRNRGAIPDGEEIMTFSHNNGAWGTDGERDGQTDTLLSQIPALA